MRRTFCSLIKEEKLFRIILFLPSMVKYTFRKTVERAVALDNCTPYDFANRPI